MTMPYRQLTQGQRYQIEAGLRAKESQANSAKQVGVLPSTISRETTTNSPAIAAPQTLAHFNPTKPRHPAGFFRHTRLARQPP
jgi:IS30 family transposase